MSNSKLQRFFLVGPMGAGKSSIGKALALLSERPFLDVDEEIVKYTNKTIPKIFEDVGEDGFRKIETEVLTHCIRHEAVIATGGGIIMREENCNILKENGTVIYLMADVETQFQRTLHDNNRPMINLDDRKARLQQLFDIRSKIYSRIADIEVNSGLHNIHDCVEIIRQKLGI